MAKTGVNLNIFQRIMGICATNPPTDGDCWQYEDGKVIVDLSRAAELSAKNGAIRLEKKGLPHGVLVFRGGDGRYYAFRNKCAHMGRRLDPVPGAEQVQCCSLGGSRYDYQGNILSGSAKKNVPTFPVIEKEGKLTITLR